MHCNGNIGFGTVSGGGGSGGPLPAIFVGNITTNGHVRSDFLQYWDQITPENEGKWASVEATRDVYNWSGLDRAYNFAKQNNIPFKQHTFIWGNQSPGWINGLSPSEQAAEIEEWIRDYCARYPDTAMIDVVNEATPGHAPAALCAKRVRQQLDHSFLPAGAAVLPQLHPDPQRLQRAELGHQRVHPDGDSGRQCRRRRCPGRAGARPGGPVAEQTSRAS